MRRSEQLSPPLSNVVEQSKRMNIYSTFRTARATVGNTPWSSRSRQMRTLTGWFRCGRELLTAMAG